MESKTLILYKWETGVYELKDLIKLVEQNIISEEDFIDITHYNFQTVKGEKNENY